MIVQAIIEDSLRKIGNVSPSTTELKIGLSTLNNIITTWNKEYDISNSEFASLSTTFTLSNEWKRALVSNLAIDLAEEYDAVLQPTLIETAKMSKLLLLRLNSKLVTDGATNTAQDIIVAAYRRVGILTPNTNELNDALSSLNNLIVEWKADMKINFLSEFTTISSTIRTLKPQLRRALIYNLAKDLGKISAVIYREAEKTKELTRRLYKTSAVVGSIDNAINYELHGGTYSVATDN